MSTLLEQWLNDVEHPHSDVYGGKDLFYLALDYGVSDPAIVRNAIALNDYALLLHEKYKGSVSYDSIVEGLLRGVQYPHQPYWWYTRLYYRFRLWVRRKRNG